MLFDRNIIGPSSEIFGNCPKNVRKSTSFFRNNFGKSSEIFRKWSEMFGKSSTTSSLVCLCNKQNITCPLADMNFIFSCSTRHTELRYRVEHSKIKFISTGGHVISSKYHIVVHGMVWYSCLPRNFALSAYCLVLHLDLPNTREDEIRVFLTFQHLPSEIYRILHILRKPNSIISKEDTAMVSYCTCMWSTYLISFPSCTVSRYYVSEYMKRNRNKTYFGMSCAVLHPITIAILQRGSPAPRKIQSQVFRGYSGNSSIQCFKTNSLITTAPPLPAIDNNFVSFSSYLALHVCCIRWCYIRLWILKTKHIIKLQFAIGNIVGIISD